MGGAMSWSISLYGNHNSVCDLYSLEQWQVGGTVTENKKDEDIIQQQPKDEYKKLFFIIYA